jgi:serine/threonine protein kinase
MAGTFHRILVSKAIQNTDACASANLVAGQTLDEWRQSQEPTVRQVAELCRAIAVATHYAHEAGVIHRDLKPSNIIVDASDAPHITDFGLAKRTADDVTLTAGGQISGTPAYMSPEQVQADSRQIDRRTDVYTLGVILFELLTGERPFRGSVPMLIHQVVENEAPSPRELSSDIPRDLENICLKCLEKDPRRRYQSANALAADLRRFLDSEPVKARPIPPHVRAWRWCKRNRFATRVTAGLFLVLLLGMTATTSQWLRAERAAVREAETRTEMELLTQQVLKLAERLRALEKSQPTAESSSSRHAEAQKDAGLRMSYSQPREPSKVGERRLSLGETESSARLSHLSSEEVRGRATLGRAASRPKRESELCGLQAEAKATIHRLEQLSPAVAQQCREAFPELVGD